MKECSCSIRKAAGYMARWRVWASVLLVALVLLAACGGDDATPTATVPAPTSTPAVATITPLSEETLPVSVEAPAVQPAG